MRVKDLERFHNLLLDVDLIRLMNKGEGLDYSLKLVEKLDLLQVRDVMIEENFQHLLSDIKVTCCSFHRQQSCPETIEERDFKLETLSLPIAVNSLVLNKRSLLWLYWAY